MRFLSILFIILFITSCDFKEKISSVSPQISREQVLKKFKKNFSDVIPSDVILSVSSFKDSPIEGLKEGVILFKSLEATKQLSFLITYDGDYIIFNPEIYNLSGPKRNEEILSKINLEKIPNKGNPKSKIVIVEYSDFQCPACKYGATKVLPALEAEFSNEVNIYFKHFPLSFHKWADDAARLTSCISLEFGSDEFWKIHDLIFLNQENFTEANFKTQVSKLLVEKNLDLNTCLESYNDEKYDKFVQDSIGEAKSLGVNSTPTFFVNGHMIKGADLLKIVEAINKFSE